MDEIDASTLNDFLLDNYFHLLAIVILYYDHLLTLGREIDLVWKVPLKKNNILFYINRYTSFLGNIVVTLSLFLPSLSNTARILGASCQKLRLFRNGLLIFSECFVGILLSQRVYGMYGCSKRILKFLVGFALILIGAALFATFYFHGRSEPIPSPQGCHTLVDPITTIQFASAWEAIFLYDSVLFGLTLHKARTTANDTIRLTDAFGDRVSLMQVVIADGSLYFVVVALSNMINILTFYLTEPAFRGALTTFASCVSVTMMSRLILNLRAADRQTGNSYSTRSLHFARPPRRMYTM